MTIVTNTFNLIKMTFSAFIKDNAPQMAASLSYYALLAIPSLLLITLSIFNLFLADNQSRMTIMRIVANNVGQSGTVAISQIIGHLDQYSDQSTTATWLGTITLILTATGVVGHLEGSLNFIWRSQGAAHHSVTNFIRQRFLSLLLIVIIGIIFFILFITNTFLALLSYFISETLGISSIILSFVNFVFSFVMMVSLIAGLYKFVPNGKMAWKDIIIGAFVTGVLFSLGKYLIGVYLDYTTIGSLYGAAGSILLLLIWIYYTSLIFFFGAEFTQVYANTHGQGITTKDRKKQ